MCTQKNDSENPQERAENIQPSVLPERIPVTQGWRGSQGYHLKGGQRSPWRSHVLLLPEQPQQDVFLILGPAVDVSVLQPGGHMLLLSIWEEHRDESEIHASLFYELNLHHSMNVLSM